jgi:hypothetical protein
LRRIVLIATALGVLVAASVAYAAINTYTAKLSFTSKKPGTAAKPVPISYTENLTAAGTAGNRTAVLLDIKTSIYGLKVDGKDFPTCSLNQISNAKNDTVCPKGAEVATGFITASVGSATNFTAAGSACDPLLDVWNSGQGKLTFFFVDTPTHQCLGGALKTGSTGPYPATYKTVGKNLVVDVPVPSYVSFPLPGVAGSLETEHLVWKSTTAKVKGKTVSSIASVACSGNKRPTAVTFKATLPTTKTNATNTVTGSSPC